MLRSKREIFLPESIAMKAATEITPRPPIWIRSRIMVCPAADQVRAVSFMTRPVTQTADAAVNSASENEDDVPLCEQTGSISRMAPARITPINPRMMI